MDNFKKHKNCHNNKCLTNKIADISSMQDKKTDPNGSYTGVPENPYDKPVQDADDL